MNEDIILKFKQNIFIYNKTAPKFQKGLLFETFLHLLLQGLTLTFDRTLNTPPLSVSAKVPESALIEIIYDVALAPLHFLIFLRGGHAHRHSSQNYVDNL